MAQTQSPTLESKLPGTHLRRSLHLPTPWPQAIDRSTPPKKINNHTHFLHPTHHWKWGRDSKAHSALWLWTPQAHILCSITTGLRSANTDCVSRKDGSWKPHSHVRDGQPCLWESKVLSAKSDSKPQEMAHSSEARVAVARQWVHKKNQAAHCTCFRVH